MGVSSIVYSDNVHTYS